MSRVDLDVEISLAQTITRADGTVEDLGVVASTADGTIATRRPGLLARLRAALPTRKDP